MFLYFFKYNKSITDCNSLRGGRFLGTPNYDQIRLSTWYNNRVQISSNQRTFLNASWHVRAFQIASRIFHIPLSRDPQPV